MEAMLAVAVAPLPPQPPEIVIVGGVELVKYPPNSTPTLVIAPPTSTACASAGIVEPDALNVINGAVE